MNRTQSGAPKLSARSGTKSGPKTATDANEQPRHLKRGTAT